MVQDAYVPVALVVWRKVCVVQADFVASRVQAIGTQCLVGNGAAELFIARLKREVGGSCIPPKKKILMMRRSYAAAGYSGGGCLVFVAPALNTKRLLNSNGGEILVTQRTPRVPQRNEYHC